MSTSHSGGNKNVLWIMADQLRWDYLSCYGHPHLHTPHIDSLAAKGVQFNNAYVQSPICGPSRMSSYTGRYCRSHGSTWNGIPLRVGEPTLGDHLRELNIRTALVGKTHMKADLDGMRRLGIDPASHRGVSISECGFEPFERDDGLHPYGPYDPNPRYNDFLREKGYESNQPWEDYANSGLDENGELLSGWLLKYSDLPANIPEELSETPYMTSRAIEFMQQAGDTPWLCHLSYIKPHWPYIVPAPYHNMYSSEHIIPVVRTEQEKQLANPLFKAFIESRICRSFSRDKVREKVIPVYMGLIKQIDDQMGRLFNWMESHGLMNNTLIVFTSDHGDYLGDHWMGEKDLFHDQSVKVPLIIYDPRAQADATRGSIREELVESIDLAPTFLRYFGGRDKPHILEGRPLDDLLHGSEPPSQWRRYAVSEYDYSTRDAREALNTSAEDSRLYMIRDERWKMSYHEGFAPMLFDLQNDPQELHDLGTSDTTEVKAVLQRLEAALFKWTRQHHSRITVSNEQIDKMLKGSEPSGILIGYWDEQEYTDMFNKPFSERP